MSERTVDGAGRTGSASPGEELAVAWRENRRYVGFAFVVFLASVAVGVVLAVQGYDLLAWLGLENIEDMFPEEFGATTILVNNSRVFLLMVAGAVTLGLLTFFGLAFNGVFIGWFAAPITAEQGVGFAAVGLLPHGIPELFAFFVAAGVGFRIVHMAARRVLGRRDVVLGRRGWRRTALLLVVAWVILAVAAVVEVYVSAALLELLYG